MTLIARLPDVERFLSRSQPLRINGAEVAGSSELDVIDPSSGVILGQIAAAGAAQIDMAVAAARAALSGAWGSLAPYDRGLLIWKLADAIEARKEVFGQLDALDNGKPFAVARDVDAVWSARHFRYFAGWPDKRLPWLRWPARSCWPPATSGPTRPPSWPRWPS